MPLLSILEPPHPSLKTPAQPVEAVDDQLRRLADDMLATMYKAPGIGLAAPQVGRSLRMFVFDVAAKDEPPVPVVVVNPLILWRSDNIVPEEEGCLSLPGQFAEVRRPDGVRMRFTDLDGNPHEVDARGLLARCLQHEHDHLDGILFTDHLSALKRNMILRKVAKRRRERD